MFTHKCPRVYIYRVLAGHQCRGLGAARHGPSQSFAKPLCLSPEMWLSVHPQPCFCPSWPCVVPCNLSSLLSSTGPPAAKSCPAPLFSRGDLGAVPSKRSLWNQEHSARVKLSQQLWDEIEDLESMLGMLLSSRKKKYYHVISKKKVSKKGFEFPFREEVFRLDNVLLRL